MLVLWLINNYNCAATAQDQLLPVMESFKGSERPRNFPPILPSVQLKKTQNTAPYHEITQIL